MKIVSVIKESFLEYEDYISLVLFSAGCNMRCSYCHNYDFIMSPENILSGTVEEIIDNNMTSLTDGLVFLGGEPTLYGTELFDISSYVKIKYNSSVKIFSNGTYPNLLIDGLNQGYFDYISLDFKSLNQTDHISYLNNWNDYVKGILKVIKYFDQHGLNHKLEIRTTSIPELKFEINKIKEYCNFFNIKHIVQEDVRQSYKELGVLNG